MEKQIELGDTVTIPTDVAINIRNFFGRTAAPLDEIGLNNIVALQAAIQSAVKKDDSKEGGKDA
jgi:hypothetical protein